MDAVHEEHLARILENRKRRGVTAGYQSSRQYGKFPDSFAGSPEELMEPSSVAAYSPEIQRPPARVMTSPSPPSPKRAPEPKMVPNVERVDRVTSPMSPMVSPPIIARQDVAASAEFAALAEEQRLLRQSQRVQEQKVDEIHRNMNDNFRSLMTAMDQGRLARQQTQQQPSLAPNNSPFIQTDRQRQQLSYFPNRSGQMLQLPQQQSTQHQIQPYRAANRPHPGLGTLPPPLTLPTGPLAAAPSAATHLDLRSAMSLMKTGEWFIKWDGKQVQAAARHVWYDYARCTLNWGPEKFTRSPFSGELPLEEVTSVTTDQMSEFDGDVDRLFFLLVIHSPRRTLYLATEKRAKLDCWYEALTIVSLYNRMHRSGVAGKAISSD
eukprot:GILI01010211.1.p1 GENE.GILI01010211.1~~GILI01010211.1.p1  ORF type:complete len:379 (+),score=38.83 GILI01010211.1:49-1185(+)